MQQQMRFVGLVSLLLFALVNESLAGPLPTDPNALAAFKGTRTYSASVPNPAPPPTTLSLIANVEYAVYQPGKFNLSFPGDDPSGGSQYVYAYQIFNDQGGNRSVSTLSVGISDPGAFPANITSVEPGLGQAPSDAVFSPASPPPNSALWHFLSTNALAVGSHSDLLIYTSPKPPKFDTSSVQGGSGLQKTLSQSLPSPIPEPTSLALGLIGLASLVAVRLIRRR